MNFSKLLSVNFGDRRIPQTLEATFRRKVDYTEPQGREVRPGNRCGNNMDTPWEEIRRWDRRPNRVRRRRSIYRYRRIIPSCLRCRSAAPCVVQFLGTVRICSRPLRTFAAVAPATRYCLLG